MSDPVQCAAFGSKDVPAAMHLRVPHLQVVGAKVLRDYTVGPQNASSGLWKIYGARCKREGSANALVSVWIMDRRPPEALRHAPHSEAAWEAIQELARK